ncbi:unnamed protein product [Phytophthora lilii]|uniref:Unnamed protein product n=1 Tax=Phytophthora lilii TaxID=2077276 RepID=A0A9W6YKC1_9STRA|nr:unnamed protein product [Phytophthora lilii]
MHVMRNSVVAASPPSSVIVVDDSSDEDTAAASGRRSAPLLVSSSDESDGGRPSLPKKPRVTPPQFSFTAAPTARKGLTYGDNSGSDDVEEPSDAQEDDSDTSEPSQPLGKKKATVKKVVKRKGFATTDSNDDTVEETQLKFADKNGRMYADAMSFSELQAQQRELERLRAKAHRITKAVPHTTARRAGTKRKASDALPATHNSPHALTKSPALKKTTSPSPFDFDFPGSSEESSSSLSSTSPTPAESRASLSSARAKPMSLKDVVAQERELARLRKENTKKGNQAEPIKKKKKPTPKPSAAKSSFSSFGEQNNGNIIDGTEWSSSGPDSDGGDDDTAGEYDAKASFQSEPLLEEPRSESDDEKDSDEEYKPSKPKQHPKSPAQSASTSVTNAKVKGNTGKKSIGPKQNAKSKKKKSTSKARPSSAKTGMHAPLPEEAAIVSDTLPHQRNASDTVMHTTLWRNVCLDSAPSNLLALDSNVALPFYLEADQPLLTYDVDGDLRSKCKLLPQFGKATQLLSSTLVPREPEVLVTQDEMDARVTELIERELPRIRACHQRKTKAILTEARVKVHMYLAAHETLWKQIQQTRGTILDKSLLNQMKQEKLSQELSVGYSNMWGETISVEERLFPQDINQLPSVRPLSKCTAYIGVKANVRVEDDPILRYLPYFGEDDDGRDIDEAWYDAIGSKDSNLSSGLDGEVNEFLLRLVVRECGTTDKVFSSLKKVPGFSQAYSDYSEIKKLDDSTRLAARRIKEAKELISSKPSGFPLTKVATLEPLLGNVEDSKKTLEERFAPPPTYFDSNLARGHANRGYGLGLRSTDDYTELLVTYRDMFCRMCYDFHCLHHGIEHPLPSNRVDPINPPLHLSAVALAANVKKEESGNTDPANSTPESSSPSASADTADNDNSTADENLKEEGDDMHTDEDAQLERGSSEACYDTATDEDATTTGEQHETRRSLRALTRISTLASRSLKKQTARPSRRKQARPHRVQTYSNVADESEYLDDSHYDWVTAIVRRSFKSNEKCSDECWKTTSADSTSITDGATTGANTEASSLSDTELVLLRKLRAIIGDNPCMLSSLVKSTMCKEVGAFLGSERQSKPLRTSSMDDMPLSPDARLNYNGRKRASEVPALVFDEERRNMSALDLGICCNVNILRGLHKKIGVAYSTTHGWGAFALEPIKRGEFIYEYHGALLSQDEAERRGSIYDKMTISFLFDVDDDSVVDAIRKGNKSKFANHSAVHKKCKGKVLTVGGEHRISIWAQQDIAKGEELFFDYGYHGETAPDWSQLRIKGSARHGSKKKKEVEGKKEEQ